MRYLILFLVIASACTDAISVNVRDGIERFEAYRNLVKGKRVGIVANHTSRVDTVHGVDFLLGKGINVVRIFCPEHGFRGTADAGETVGDYIDASTGASGTVKEIQIFHTILITPDNKMVYVPNGAMSSGVITNYSNLDTRRIEWNFGVDYGEDFEKVEKILRNIIKADQRILTAPAPFIELGELAASSVNIKVRVWVKSSDYWDVFFYMNQTVYATFNKEGINFPFPQLTVHQA